MVPVEVGPCGPFQKVRSVVSTRSRPCSRETQPWSMPMQMADSRSPDAAMLQGEPGVLRSLIRPLAGFASSQKKSKAVRSSSSRSSASVMECAVPGRRQTLTISVRIRESTNETTRADRCGARREYGVGMGIVLGWVWIIVARLAPQNWKTTVMRWVEPRRSWSVHA
jgi:hypothetical protein